MPNAIPAGATDNLPPGPHDRPAGTPIRCRRVRHPAHRRVPDRTALARGARPPVDRDERRLRPEYSIYGAIWRRIVKVAKLGPTEPEHEYPPRFAQVLGSIALLLALVAFALGATTLGWVFVLGGRGLQTLLAVTGYCLGCRLYFLRWLVPDLVTRLWTRGRVRRLPFAVEPIQYN